MDKGEWARKVENWGNLSKQFPNLSLLSLKGQFPMSIKALDGDWKGHDETKKQAWG